ncbi:MAG TPA: hypothetical protein PLD27_07800 [bacterium]|nr:hypothetical protein [bacterium]HPQ19117.1 hypothetical protein [bacterium]
MLICFGVSWPFSIYKTIKTKRVQGKSGIFLVIVEIGYLFGILHKLFYNFDFVIFFYCFNFLLVGFDLILWLKYNKQ